ncbi:MAG: CRISPR-associated endonuclease Cas2 [Pirellulaceae bacterium]|nr:CRISPR-associated endonuclease Cas2 [Pirellulaceae bacterium]
MYWIVAYDVSSDRRRNRVAKQLERAGIRIQKSVFLVHLPRPAVQKLLGQLGQLIEPRADQVAAWPLQADWLNTQIVRPEGARPWAHGSLVV